MKKRKKRDIEIWEDNSAIGGFVMGFLCASLIIVGILHYYETRYGSVFCNKTLDVKEKNCTFERLTLCKDLNIEIGNMSIISIAQWINKDCELYCLFCVVPNNFTSTNTSIDIDIKDCSGFIPIKLEGW